MSFLFSIALLLALVSAICLPYFVGHGLALHEWSWVLTGIGFGVLSGILMLITNRLARGRKAAH